MVEPDQAMAAGLVLLSFAVPSIFAAFADYRQPVLGGLMAVCGGLLIAWASFATPGGYALADIPDVLVRVAGQILN